MEDELKLVKCQLRGFCVKKFTSTLDFETNAQYEKAREKFFDAMRRSKRNPQKVVIMGMETCSICGSISISFRGG